MILAVARAFFVKGFQEAVSYRVSYFLKLLGVAVSLAAFYFLARFIDSNPMPRLDPYGGRYLTFGLVGMIMINLQQTAVAAYPRSVRAAQVAGTLEAMLATPTPGWLVLICAPLYQFAAAFLWAVVYVAAGGLLFDMRFDQANVASIALTLPLCLVAFASLGFVSAALTMLLRRSDPLSMALGGVSALLGGVFYPTSVLPAWLRSAGSLLPITHALELIRRAAFGGASVSELSSSLIGMSIFCAVMTPIGLLAFSLSLRRARRDGSLTHY